MERKRSMKDKDGNEIPLTPKDQSYFIALRDSINKAQRNIEPGSDYQKGAIAMANDILDMIERILK